MDMTFGQIGCEGQMQIINPVFSRVFKQVFSEENWNPLSLFEASEPGVWFDPSDLTTLFQDSAGITPVTAAGQTVGKMLDKSGRGNHATQTTLAQRPTYQIDSTGRPYLAFDGVDDGMVTPTITPATNKVQVFAGVRKLSDATTGIPVEFSATVNSNSGSFIITAPSNTAGRFSFLSRGSIAPVNAAISVVMLAPTTRTITCLADISADNMTLNINSSQITKSSDDQGTGNYLAYPLYIGRRGGTTFPFNGRLYSLITRFGANLNTTQITSTESWVNEKTGAY
jgi:hypothetical protein